MTRLLIVNPNISTSVTDLIEAEARRSIAPGTTLAMATAPYGVAYIETRFEAMIGAMAVAEVVGQRWVAAGEDGAAGRAVDPGVDAIIVAAFGDPGLGALREVSPVPVVGMTEAALAAAMQLGGRLSIIAISRRIEAWYREVVTAYGLASRLASIRFLDRPLAAVDSVQQAHGDALVALGERAVAEDGADVLILAGAPLAGLARTVAGRLPVPEIDGVSAAVRQAELLAAARPMLARAGSYAGAPDKPDSGLSAALQALRRARQASG